MTIPTLYGSDGRRLVLGPRVGKGGEGEVYAIEGAPDIVVKFYTVSDVQSRKTKIEGMISARLANSSKLIAFPLDVVKASGGVFAGFTMQRVVKHQPLHELYSPGARKAAFPRADYKFLVRAATNAAKAVASAHSVNCVIGDINHSGILISDQAIAALIDADSFQFTVGSVQYLCRVGVPEYTPPELQGRSLDIPRTLNHDAFGLAVVIFQLLWMGRHPFSGRYAKGDMPIDTAIAEHRFAYSTARNVAMDPPPGVPCLKDFPHALGQAFEAAFGPPGVNQRPTATQWIALLMELEAGLKPCRTNPLHHAPSEALACPWCKMEGHFGIQLFLPTYEPGAGPQTGAAIGDIAAIWRAIEGVAAPPTGQFSPNLPGTSAAASAEAVAAKTANRWRKVVGFGIVLAAVGAAFAAPKILLIWLAIGAFGLVRGLGSNSYAAFAANARDVEVQWLTTLDDWRRRCNDTDFVRIRASLTSLKREYDGLSSGEAQRIREFATNRRAAHLRAFLERFQIRRHRITGVGPSKLATLTSYGVETAADVTAASVQRVPGFGPVNSKPLLDWREKLEKRFVYSDTPTPADQAAIDGVRAEFARKAAALRTQMATGPEALAKAATVAMRVRSSPDPELSRLHSLRAQATADLKLLGLVLPPVQLTRAAASAPRPAPHRGQSPQPPPAPTTTQGTACPNCGSRMILRVARRGRNKGGKFYGCVRYPSCKGTRSHP